MPTAYTKSGRIELDNQVGGSQTTGKRVSAPTFQTFPTTGASQAVPSIAAGGVSVI